MGELEALKTAFLVAGGDEKALDDPGTAHLALGGNRILSMKEADGLSVRAEETPEGMRADITVLEGARVENPVHLCFGVLEKRGRQKIELRFRLLEGASVSVVAHCVFPYAVKVLHAMDADVEVGPCAKLSYREAHYHGTYGGVEVDARAKVKALADGTYLADFSLLEGRVGRLLLDYEARVGRGAVSELSARVFGRGRDEIRIIEKAILEGEGARSLIRSRVALADDSYAEVTGVTEGNADGARGHVDCMEIVRDRAHARALPLVSVNHPGAKVTHEAAIGSVDRKQLETLLARGLKQEEAVDVIVRGILR